MEKVHCSDCTVWELPGPDNSRGICKLAPIPLRKKGTDFCGHGVHVEGSEDDPDPGLDVVTGVQDLIVPEEEANSE